MDGSVMSNNKPDIKRLCILANLALITLGAYFGVSIFYRLIGMQLHPTQSLAPGALTDPVSRATGVRPVDDYEPILARDLFRISKAEQAVPVQAALDVEKLQRTRLNLKLWGTVAGDPLQACAVIEDMQRREQSLYRVGDTIQNATVIMILREKVVLNFEGQDEILDMVEFPQAAGPGMAMHGTLRAMPPDDPMGMPEADQQITLQRGMLDESFSDVNRLMTEISISPNMEEGEPAGLLLNRIAPDSIFRRMGLRNGDVLLGVNGRQILSAEDAMQMYESLRSSEEIEIQLKRRGHERTITYTIR
jgi:general secretion pathway protein C